MGVNEDLYTAIRAWLADRYRGVDNIPDEVVNACIDSIVEWSEQYLDG
jgi:hypothetical protein